MQKRGLEIIQPVSCFVSVPVSYKESNFEVTNLPFGFVVCVFPALFSINPAPWNESLQDGSVYKVLVQTFEPEFEP